MDNRYKYILSTIEKEYTVDNGIIGGYSNGKFGVGDNITREQV